jgi:hypothetical protein
MNIRLIALLSISVSAFADLNSGTQNIYNGESFGQFFVRNDATVNVFGGQIDAFYMEDHSTLNVYSGNINVYASLIENSTANFFGGITKSIMAGENSRVTLSGGQIKELQSKYYSADPQHITLICQSGYLLTYTNTAITGVSGLWIDGTSFNIKLGTMYGSDILSNITIIPEPATMLLLGIGGLLIRRK